jgi:hypothetical protein
VIDVRESDPYAIGRFRRVLLVAWTVHHNRGHGEVIAGNNIVHLECIDHCNAVDLMDARDDAFVISV